MAPCGMSAFLFIFLAPFLRYLYPKVSSSSAASKGTFNPLLTIKKQNAILSFHLLNEKGKEVDDIETPSQTP